ncbi:MAG TPA: hypothetical protein VFM48_09805 [Aquabacterium sp.]|nr:hypothetical protein [Aquabacterium sp.]
MRSANQARLGILAVALLASISHAPLACAQPAHAAPPPARLAVHGKLNPPPKGVTDLKFNELFKLPVGPKGLEMSEKRVALEGQPVRMVGYVASAEEPTPGLLILTPLPVVLGDEDEKLVDDLPPSAVFVHLSPAYAKATPPNFAGLIQLTGRLEGGPKEEADGHVSTTRLYLDDATSNALIPKTTSQKVAHKHH